MWTNMIYLRVSLVSGKYKGICLCLQNYMVLIYKLITASFYLKIIQNVHISSLQLQQFDECIIPQK